MSRLALTLIDALRFKNYNPILFISKPYFYTPASSYMQDTGGTVQDTHWIIPVQCLKIWLKLRSMENAFW